MDTPMGQPAMAAPQEVRVSFTTTSPDLQLPEDRSSVLVVPTGKSNTPSELCMAGFLTTV